MTPPADCDPRRNGPADSDGALLATDGDSTRRADGGAGPTGSDGGSGGGDGGSGSAAPPPEDELARALLSGSTYEYLRAIRGMRVGLAGRLAWLTVPLYGLALVLPLYAAFPASVGPYLPSPDPGVATPGVLVLGAFGGTMVSVAAVVLAVAGWYRLRYAPVSDRQARRILNMETFASVVGFGMGGIPVGVTLAYFLLGFLGPGIVAAYGDLTGGANPFAASSLGLTVEAVGAAALFVGVAVWTTSHYLSMRLSLLEVP